MRFLDLVGEATPLFISFLLANKFSMMFKATHGLVLFCVGFFLIMTPSASFKKITTPAYNRIIKTVSGSSLTHSAIKLKMSSRDNIVDFTSIINPTKFDTRRIALTLGGQALLLTVAVTVGNFLGLDVLHLENMQTEIEVLKETVVPALGIFAAIFSFSYFLRDVQLPEIQQFFRERKFYVLKTLGIQTNVQQAALIAALLAMGEAFSEEIFFRGLCFPTIHTPVADDIAILFGALISGLAHVPIFGSNFFVESVLSMIYGASFLASDFNVIVPMTIHAIYSLVSMYVTWYFSTADIRKRINQAKVEDAALTKVNDTEAVFEAIAKSVSCA